MQLTVRQAAELLKVSEKTIYRWIKQGRTPALRLNGRIRLQRSELLEWATANRINVAPAAYQGGEDERTSCAGLEEALRDGGIYYRVGGHDVFSVLRSVVDIIPVAEGVSREQLFRVLLARESLVSTSAGRGISIPHPRNPLLMLTGRSTVSLCFLEQPVDFHALDGQPVHTLFVVISPGIHTHLQLIARIAFALQQPFFMELIEEQASREEILKAAGEIDRAARPGRKAQPGG
jgi:PTS system nitrogen regulatory IIA component